MARTAPDEFGCVSAGELLPGDRIAVSYGIVTVREVIHAADERVYIVPVENQPAVGVSRFANFHLKVAAQQ